MELIRSIDLTNTIAYILSIVFSNTHPCIQRVKTVCIALYGSPEGEFNGNVYILNFPDKKKYCGQTVNLHARMNQHKSARKQTKRLQSALDKQPFSDLMIEHIEVPLCATDPLEIFFIQY